MSVLYYFHRFDAFLHIFGEMRGRRILTKLSTHFEKGAQNLRTFFVRKLLPKKKMDMLLPLNPATFDTITTSWRGRLVHRRI